MTGTTTRTNDQLADSWRENFGDTHARVDASSHPRKQRLQRLLGAAHCAMEAFAREVNDDGGSGDITARAGDDKD